MKTTIFTILALAATVAASAQQSLTLDDCRRLAAENNAKVRIAQGNTEAASEVSKDAFTKYFPQIDANWTGFTANKGVLQYRLPSMAQLLPEGVDALIPPELAGIADRSLGDIELIKKGWVGSVMAVQPVFMGGLIVNGNKLAHVGEEVAKLEQQNAVDEVLVTVEEYYWQVVTLKTKKHTLEAVLTMVDTLAAHVGAAVDAGILPRNEVLKVKLRRNELRALMVDLDNGITLSTNLLSQYIGKKGEPIEVATEPVPEEVPAEPIDIFMEPSSALPLTADYQLLNSGVKASELRTKMAVGENLPQVGVGAGWTYDDLFSQKHNFLAAMVTVNVPITAWWGGSHRIKKAQIEEKNARIQQEDLSELLEIKMQNAWDDLTSAHRKMTIAHESIAQSTENLRLNENYYKAGIVTIDDLLDAQTLYRLSQDQYTESYGNFRIERARYLSATGRLR